ncbi:hypothetical protein MYP_251 [Sporocytophaga myxococcoides]|uniref:Secretion system C-terminal sorting domain-containing protein n=1 Tax=Sporocytophaga myxococcoides TaxID=153721 RepID=A0A098L8F5_9BACT|nr:glycan-binding surface protein [Sporocytophaga myxococcoides]GAL83025.1 hypothetical protein MYP_251 [Sporocytophaga myxococcoides]
MKKQLLSGLMVLATTFSFAQTIVYYDGTDNFLNSPVTDAGNVFDNLVATEPTDGPTGAYLHLVGPSTEGGYYVGGFVNAHYLEDGSKAQILPLEANADLSKINLSFDAFTNGTTTKVKFQFQGTPNNFGYEWDLTAEGAKAGWKTITLPLSELQQIIGNDPTGDAPTVEDVNSFSEFQIIVVCTNNSGVCDAEANIDNIKVSGPGVIASILNNARVSTISLAPNPASDFTTLNYNATAETVVNVADLKGTVVKTVKGSTTSATINTSDLTSGLYVVTVNVDGVPSAVEKLVVK